MVLADIARISGQRFNFVIIGGGTSGLCLAARLTENPKVTVAVLEAGPAHLNDPAILTPAAFTRQIANSEYDWMFKTAPQAHTGDIEYTINSGKGLGGSSCMNFLAYNRPTREDIDAYETLGNPGWNWESFEKYCKRSERYDADELYPRSVSTESTAWRFIPGRPEALSKYGQKYEQDTLGIDGNLALSFPAVVSGGDLALRATLESKGIRALQSPLQGEVTGTWCSVSTIDIATQTRANSVTAYLQPNMDRPNLRVLTGAFVNKIITSVSQAGVTASGVEFTHGGVVHEVYTDGDVVLCAGALQSPKILELSGIGSKKILEKAGVETKLDLPGVGNNVQEHISHAGVSFELKDDNDIQTWDLLRNPDIAAKQRELYINQKQGLLTMVPSSLTFLPLQTFSHSAAAIINRQAERLQKDSHLYTAATLAQYQIQLANLRDPRLPDIEFIGFPGFRGYPNVPEPGKRYYSLVPALCHPFSRGSTHIASNDPRDIPRIDPCYLEQSVDLDIMVEIFKFCRSLGKEGPLKDIITKEVNPGPDILEGDQIREHVKLGFKSTWHTCGSLSMLPLESGGVVDPQLKVWGTSNIRVADLSVAPLQVASHTQALVYSIAEKAADIIKNGSNYSSA
ncbi:GMC oxidoreductase [Neolentinus lepideus HHB14362 ss-1]|uniref:GMC oxidoreductase n=1 Tax=Neolentinus lepideus HHB14362 ss-1 TaxID=1314782 RepID=A0A165SYE9_9AGAM|nr:GMC oxidoreductase [Neolentinus lepideus HHB14362 ss-1]